MQRFHCNVLFICLFISLVARGVVDGINYVAGQGGPGKKVVGKYVT